MHFGIVKDIKDPKKIGRVKVKVFDLHDSINVSDLAWSQVLMPANVPARLGVGASVNLLVGTLVACVPLDKMKQEFIVTGTLPTNSDITTDDDTAIGGSAAETKSKPDNNSRVRGEPDPHADESKGKYQPKSTYGPIYPHNNVMETESGHVREYDDTPGAERITERHKSGTQYEIAANGSKIERIVRDNYQLILGHDTIEVRGNVKIYVNGDANIAVARDLTTQVGGNMTADVTGNMTSTIAGATSLTSVGDITVTQNGIDSSTVTLKSEYTKDDIVYKGNIKLDGEVSVTENLVVEKDTTTNNSTTKIVLGSHQHAGDGGDNSGPNTGGPANP